MAKKIKTRTKTREEREAEKKAAAEEKAREKAGIQDEFQAKGFELVEWAQEHRQVILGAIGVVVVVGAVLGIYTLVSTSRDTAASATFAEAALVWEGEVGPALPGLGDENKPRFETAKAKAEKALESFEKVIAEHGGTGAADLAHLYAGHAAIYLEKWDVAVQHYSAYLDEQPAGDELAFAALAGRATAHESKGELDKAIADHKRQLDLSMSPAKDAALLSLARLHAQQGDAAQATKYLDDLKKDFPDSALTQTAEQVRAKLPGAASSTPPAEKSAG